MSLKKPPSRWHFNLPSSLTVDNHASPFATSFLHPTRAQLVSTHDGDERTFSWHSRNHRKNRHVHVSPINEKSRYEHNLFKRLARMTSFEWWNISWWVAILFTLGSIVWVVNGFYAFLPMIESLQLESDTVAIGWTAWLGATIFEIGAVLGVLEALGRSDRISSPSSADYADVEKHPHTLKGRWLPRRPMPFGQYFRELGFLAAFVQLWAATIFWISGFTALPQIQSAIEEDESLYDGVYWTPQVIGGSGFILSSALLMLEVQKRWYLPAPLSLGWQIGVWNLIGAIGFTLCGALGYGADHNTKLQYQSDLSTFWGGWAFLIGSIIQWYESVNSVEV